MSEIHTKSNATDAQPKDYLTIDDLLGLSSKKRLDLVEKRLDMMEKVLKDVLDILQEFNRAHGDKEST